MTTEQTALQRLKAICEAATPGPWRLKKPFSILGDTYHVAQLYTNEPDCSFVLAVRTALPALIELCEAYEAEMTDYWHGKVMNNDRSKAARARLEDVCPK